MSIDQTKHSLFGASKLAADVLVQEYGRYFGMKTVCFRGGCLTGPAHAGTELHGFLAYLMKCTALGNAVPGISVTRASRCGTTSTAIDLVNAFWEFFAAPRSPPRSTTSVAAGILAARCSRRSTACERISGEAELDIRTGQPDRGPHLVGQRRGEVPGALPAVELPLRPRRDPAGDSRCRGLGSVDALSERTMEGIGARDRPDDERYT